MRTITDGI